MNHPLRLSHQETARKRHANGTQTGASAAAPSASNSSKAPTSSQSPTAADRSAVNGQQSQQASGESRSETSPDTGDTNAGSDNGGSAPDPSVQGWVVSNGVKHWYDHGVMVKDEQVYDPESRAWYQLDAQDDVVTGEFYWSQTHDWYDFDKTGAMVKGMDYIHERNGSKWVYYSFDTGAMAHDEQYLDFDGQHTGWYLFDHYTGAVTYGWKYLAQEHKWVYYGVPDGRMRKGEQDINGAWYYFDPSSGAVTYGWKYLPQGRKWVYYGFPDGRMRKGEQCINGAWYYFNDWTGATLYGWQWDHGKQVFYDRVSGKMVHGAVMIDGMPYYFDQWTGRRYARNEIIGRLLAQARSSYGKNIDAPGILAANGGLICPFGPCMAWVWWVFHESGLGIFLADGAASGWPHHNFDWYQVHGRVSMTPQVGDIAFYKWPGWANAYSASHAGIVVSVNGGHAIVADAIFGGIGERPSYNVLVGYAHPYWG
ncbi:CHAP domain-containing protein [Bifidobacterium tibiigranuli]|uniref:CHAP domain-containing protein n=1 Tax=Bifidobacterium tibiigranuli TaxID=2172043 RepID=UPI0023563587|nr:CHAP domain-containing protein [Bifidobacterium tibiigranuli]MCI1221138.1 CHAP domain-containing protein [Bifidobacterium tibiigranuli]